MAPSFDCAISTLFCAEDNDSLFYDESDEVGYACVEVFEDHWDHRNDRNSQHQRASLTDLPVQSEECLALMIRRESELLPACDYSKRLRNGELDIAARDEVLDWITKVHAHFNFGPLCVYLAVNYLDRFLSAYELPGNNWMMQLLGVACLSLAAKMEETEVPLSLDLQVGDARFVFEARTIQRMELLVLSTLKWRMQAVTPFSFIDYFLTKINGDQIASSSSIMKCIDLILSTLQGVHFLEFRPSEIAAAVAISIAVETEAVDSEKAISLMHHVQKDRAIRCVELMQQLSLPSGFLMAPRTSLPSTPHSPIGVLDAACLSYKTEDSGAGSRNNSSHNSPVAKRRKLSHPYLMDH
ncbi:PREDICTED: cyclin-D4-2-like isoform X2 [Ipomoea nil]|uniref:cyclin-D4-2-like isoform X2 n=1 Tax=Ipomoea nil TaxID=35883 RepID=UPI000900DDE6|nr:PREDICTED: cyclin-D4-2-like isoform X2 [Ipomoea nil]